MSHPHQLATKPKQTNFKPFNLLLLLGVAAVGVALMVVEGYVQFLHWPFIVFSLAVSAINGCAGVSRSLHGAVGR